MSLTELPSPLHSSSHAKHPKEHPLSGRLVVLFAVETANCIRALMSRFQKPGGCFVAFCLIMRTLAAPISSINRYASTPKPQA